MTDVQFWALFAVIIGAAVGIDARLREIVAALSAIHERLSYEADQAKYRRLLLDPNSSVHDRANP